MNPKKRIETIRLIDKIDKNKEYSRKIDVKNKSKLKGEMNNG